jgi:mannose-6-phosphate isomerase-like protein (cupin superfamily)
MSATTQPKLSLPSVLSEITEVYSPRLVGNINSEYDIKVAKIKGPFIWHSHPNTDEVFYILNGTLMIQVENNGVVEDIVLRKGELFVVPKGVRHRPTADEEAEVMMIEKVGTINTGDQEGSSLTKDVVDVRTK